MQMCSGRISGTAYIPDNIALIDRLSDGYCNGQHMSVQGRRSVTVRNLYPISVATAATATGVFGIVMWTSIVCSGNGSGTGSNDWLPLDTAVGNVDALV